MQGIEVLDAEELQEMDASLGILQYVTGKLDGRDYWAYFILRPSMYEEYNRKAAEGIEVELSDFGKIVKEGFEKEPSVEIQQEIMAKYDNPQLNYFMEQVGQKLLDRDQVRK